MSHDNRQDHISKRTLVSGVPGMDAVKVRRDVVYGTDAAGALTMDIYYPPSAAGGARPPAAKRS